MTRHTHDELMTGRWLIAVHQLHRYNSDGFPAAPTALRRRLSERDLNPLGDRGAGADAGERAQRGDQRDLGPATPVAALQLANWRASHPAPPGEGGMAGTPRAL